MKVAELLLEMGRLWPRHRDQVQTWAQQYGEVLGPFAGEQLARAWSETLRTWAFDRPPPPAIIAKGLPESTAPSRDRGTGSGPPLMFGREHFDVCRRVAWQLQERWRKAHVARLDGSRTALCAAMEAGVRAHELAGAIVQRGYRDAPATAWIPWTEEDWQTMAGRARSQARLAGIPIGAQSKLKPLHVPMPGLSAPARAPPQPPAPTETNEEPITAEGDVDL